ncbi:MAG: Oligopeptide transport system permease protein OppB [Planctomycetes bacterium ADurb.Bin412]|nr:MAG: Oligopeptide transport system permease protein OppB [Planctomycetes bacterium ADurb.Bin412]
MWRHIAVRLVLCPVLLWAIYTITFLMAVIIPGNPFKQSERNLSPEVQRAVEAQYKADDNLAFYFDYLRHLFQPIKALRGRGPLVDLGPSWQYRDWTCNQIVAEALPVSIGLGLTAMFLATVLGVPIGVISAVRRNSLIDYTSLGIALIGISLPTFVTGTALLIFFSVMLGWLPVGGWGKLSQLWLPAITLAFPFMAYIARLTRLGMLDVLESDYIRTARAKGLAERAVIWKHALKNAFLPVLSFLGPACAAALTGSFVIESIFNIPGLGQHFVASILNRDRAMILATVLVYSAVIVFFNLLVDFTYSLVDPRIEVGKS